MDGYKKAQDEYKKLEAAAYDQAVSAEERDSRMATAAAKKKSIQEMETNIRSFDAQAQSTLDEMKRRRAMRAHAGSRSGPAKLAQAFGFSRKVTSIASMAVAVSPPSRPASTPSR